MTEQKMQKANVSYPIEFGENRKVLSTENYPRFIITDKKQFGHYKELFPNHFEIVKPIFERELRDNNKIIVNKKGGWCVENEEIKIVEYID
jgi:hypothetical protein